MKAVKEKVYTRLKDDETIRTLLGIVTPGSSDFKIRWHFLPENPTYPSIIYKRLTTSQDKRFSGFKSLKVPMNFELSIYDDTPSPEIVDDIKDRITELFHEQEQTLSDTHIHFYSSIVVDDIGDSFLDTQNRWFSTIRLEFIVVKVCDLLNNT